MCLPHTTTFVIGVWRRFVYYARLPLPHASGVTNFTPNLFAFFAICLEVNASTQNVVTNFPKAFGVNRSIPNHFADFTNFLRGKCIYPQTFHHLAPFPSG